MGEGLDMFITQHFEVGDIIKIKSIWIHIANYPIWHYGVVVENDQVIHFNLDTEIYEMKIIKTSIDKFVGLGSQIQKCFISEFHKSYEPYEIVKRAHSVLGTDFGGYDLLRNNCEHFANWCASGAKFSNQVPSSEDEHSSLEKLIENVVYEPVVKFCDKSINFLERIVDFCDFFDL